MSESCKTPNSTRYISMNDIEDSPRISSTSSTLLKRTAYHNAGLNPNGSKKMLYEQPILIDESLKQYAQVFYTKFESLWNSAVSTSIMIDAAQKSAARICKRGILKRHLLLEYIPFIEGGNQEILSVLRKELIGKKMRSQSGVLVITVATSGDFPGGSCPANCSFCPNQRDSKTGRAIVPRSYLAEEIRSVDSNGVETVAYYGEPSVVRALEVDFDPMAQILYRVYQYIRMGIPVDEIDKLDFRVLGGTFSYYSIEYQEWFLKMIYYTCNIIQDAWQAKTQTFKTDGLRPCGSISEEIAINSEANVCSVIGLSVETRPDHVNDTFCKRMRKYGVTKIEVGVQHLDPDILDFNNRGHYAEHAANALKTLCQFGFKKHIHVMPDLPSSTPEKDLAMWLEIITNEKYRPDETKIYPCMITDHTEIKKWYENGDYTPYSVEELTELLISMMEATPYYMRLPRIVRDIPDDMVIGADYGNSLRDNLKKRMDARGIKCKDVREREVKQANVNPNLFNLFVEKYEASGGIEYFISYETEDRSKLAGLLRLHHRRLGDLKINVNDNTTTTTTATATANIPCNWIIRELHVYGPMQSKRSDCNNVKVQSAKQHIGFGTRLLEAAEKIVVENGDNTLAVISGVGVRKYYQKRGYIRMNSLGYLFKDNLKPNVRQNRFQISSLMVCMILVILWCLFETFALRQVCSTR